MFTSPSGIFAPDDGWYKDSSGNLYSVESTIVTSFDCTECPGPPVYTEINVSYLGSLSTPECTACCDTTGTSAIVYGNGTTLATSTIIYANIEGTTPATAGYYKDINNITYSVSITGAVLVVNCSSCICPTIEDSLFAVGNFVQYGAAASSGIAGVSRFTNQSTIGFNVGTGFTHNLGIQYMNTRAVIEHDNAIYVIGNFTHYKGVSVANGIVKLDANGNLDPSFIVTTGFVGSTSTVNGVTTISSFGTNKILISGSFSTYNGVSSPGLVCINNDGTIDPSFVIGTGSASSPTANPYNVTIIKADGTNVWMTTYYWKGTNYLNNSSASIIKLNNIGNVVLTYQVVDIRNSGSLVMDSVGRIYALILASGVWTIKRFLSTGLLDPSYSLTYVHTNPGTAINVTLALDSSDNLFIQTLNLATINGVSFKNIAKYNSSGVKITAFVCEGFTPNAIYSGSSMKIIADSLYWHGISQNSFFYGSSQVGSIVKMSATTGTIDLAFIKRDAKGYLNQFAFVTSVLPT